MVSRTDPTRPDHPIRFQRTARRPLEEFEADIQAVEKKIVAMLREVAG